MNLRPYQEVWISELREAMRMHRSVLGVLPTGGGKTACFSYMVMQAQARGKRVVLVAHRAEIVDQISAALNGLGVQHGRIQPGHTMTNDLVQVAMVQTLARRMDEVDEPDFFIVDEAHHAAAGTWDRLLKRWRRAFVLGVTATPQRLDGRGLGDAFDHMIVGPHTGVLIGDGFLSGFDYLAPPRVADFSAVRTRAGDFAVDDLAEVMDKSVITGDAVEHYRRHLDGRPAIAFCVTRAHAEHVAAQFASAGFRAASVDGTMDGATRRTRLASIGDGRLNVLTSCDLISEGTDIPIVAGAILLRPTQSLSMFLQQIGRVLRLKPDGGRAVILDHVGSVHRHGLPDIERPWTLEAKPKRAKPPSVRTCETCFRSFMAATAREDAADCQTESCPMQAVAGEARREIEQQAGVLEMVDRARVEKIRATPLRELLTGRETRAELEEIRQAKGYAAGWVWHVLQKRRERRAVAA